MKLSISRDVKLLSLSFFLIFFAYNSIQQFITPFFAEIGIPSVGFWSLILIYVFFFLFGPFATIVVSQYGAKKSMIIGSLFYSLFILSLLTKQLTLIYLASSLAGIAASLLWTGQNSYIIKASSEKSYGSSSGYFNSFLTLGSALGSLLLGFFLTQFNFNIPFVIYSFFPLISLLLLSQLTDLRTEQQSNKLMLIKKSITSINALKLSAFYFSFSFIFGLVISIIPIEIKNTFSTAHVGTLSFVFWIMPILFSYAFGRLSDIKGRKTLILSSYIIGLLGLLSFYFLDSRPLLLIMGIVLLAISYAIFRPISFALVGDVSTSRNLIFITGLFWMAQNIGVLTALILSSQIQTKTIYLISICTMIFSFVILLPLLKLGFKEIQLKLSQEIKP